MRRVLATATVISVMLVALAVPATALSPSAFDKELTGTPKADTIKGGSGDDLIRGIAGKDDLSGQKGDDKVIGGRGKDKVRGGGGNDELYGGKGFDKLNGGYGADLLVGGEGEDTLLGGRGNDTINAAGDGASDFVNCGPGGNDVATVDPEDVVTQCETVTVVK